MFVEDDGRTYDTSMMLSFGVPDPEIVCLYVTRDYRHVFIAALVRGGKEVSIHRASESELAALNAKYRIEQLNRAFLTQFQK